MRIWTDVKINLGLSVLRRRPDGFHDLETLFVPYRGFSDKIEIEPLGQGSREDGSMDLVEISISQCDWDPRTDLTVKAYEILKTDYPDLPAVRISLEKNVPVGAGLGGGSADAAYVLRMLNSMFSLGLSQSGLAGYASRLGSDCAFFIYDRPMIGTGRGEVLEPYDLNLEDYEIRVEIPAGVNVSTKEAYGGIVPRERRPDGSALMPLREALSYPVEQWNGLLVNDFETTLFSIHPEIAELKRSMYERGAVYASMSGSGSSVFGIFKKR